MEPLLFKNHTPCLATLLDIRATSQYSWQDPNGSILYSCWTHTHGCQQKIRLVWEAQCQRKTNYGSIGKGIDSPVELNNRQQRMHYSTSQAMWCHRRHSVTCGPLVSHSKMSTRWKGMTSRDVPVISSWSIYKGWMHRHRGKEWSGTQQNGDTDTAFNGACNWALKDIQYNVQPQFLRSRQSVCSARMQTFLSKLYWQDRLKFPHNIAIMQCGLCQGRFNSLQLSKGRVEWSVK